MPSHMFGQTFATKRNAQAELLSSFVIRSFSQALYKLGFVSEVAEPETQVEEVRDDGSDVFDHYAKFPFTATSRLGKRVVECWGQTTCYKGNALGVAEANKTYELRESLIEALGLRRALEAEHKNFRTFHITWGHSSYSYGWMKLAKESAFDISIYLDESISPDELFEQLDKVLTGQDTEEDQYVALERATRGGISILARAVGSMVVVLKTWYEKGCPQNLLANKQSELLQKLRNTRAAELQQALRCADSGGEGIKTEALRIIKGGPATNKSMLTTLERIFSGKPFLQSAIKALENWQKWVASNVPGPDSGESLSSYVLRLWNLPKPERLVVRRILVRAHQMSGVKYAQDFDIKGVTEHNLYQKDFSSSQDSSLVSGFESKFRTAGIKTASRLHEIITSSEAKGIIRASLTLECKNGTTIRPSFIYVEEALKGDFAFKSFEEAGLRKAIGYQSSFGEGGVASYENLKVICDRKTGKPLAIIKAKYFRKQEFPRRAKEEAYVGLTLKYALTGGTFVESYPGIPLIMFVDMDKTLKPPPFAVTRLVTVGWDVYFSLDSLRTFIKARATAQVR